MEYNVRVQFVGDDRTLEAAVGESLLELAERHDIDLDHACGGVCACSTCHVKIRRGAKCFNETTEDEEDQLDNARDLDLTSRLGCQARIQAPPPGDEVIEIQIPDWNVNLSREG